jgi:hypothetical protein
VSYEHPKCVHIFGTLFYWWENGTKVTKIIQQRVKLCTLTYPVAMNVAVPSARVCARILLRELKTARFPLPFLILTRDYTETTYAKRRSQSDHSTLIIILILCLTAQNICSWYKVAAFSMYDTHKMLISICSDLFIFNRQYAQLLFLFCMSMLDTRGICTCFESIDSSSGTA